MKLTVYMAVSIDGLITKGDNDSDWVSKSDWDQLYSYIKSSDAIIMGRKTMEQFGKDFPVEGAYNIVLSNNPKLHKKTKKFVIMSGGPDAVFRFAQENEFHDLLLIGGSNTNSQFLKAGLVDEIILSIHPLVIGKGLKVFGDDSVDVSLEIIGTKEINHELVQIKYRVMKLQFQGV